ncbi:S-layer homology domain-containing protein [Brevibacillus choshinensis]|nr:S-layer homology domain-containing protein [Brevibacillus choshinensis]
MHYTARKLRTTIASYLTLIMLLTALLPVGIVSAAADVDKIGNWSAIDNPGYALRDQADKIKFGTEALPVLVSNRVLNGIKLTNDIANNNAVSIKVDEMPVSYSPALTFTGKELTIPTITIDRDGKVTKVEVTFGSEKATMFYKLDKQKSGATLSFTAPTNANGTGTADNPILVTNNKVTDLSFAYTDTNDKTPQMEVQLNGVPVQTFSSATNPKAGYNGETIKISTIDLKPGLNVIKVIAVNTGYEQYLYYDYQQKDAPIILTDYSGIGTSINNALLSSVDKITLRGVFGSGVTGANLRLKITTNNGQNVQDLTSTTPVITGNTFTFTDVSLNPGLNVITFYERSGSVTKEHLSFYVEYNNTPVIDSIKVNDTVLTSSTTLITVSSANRLTLNVDGVVKNAERVFVKNATTGDEVQATVTSGTFAANIPSILGENKLEFTAYSNNKKVGIIYRTIHVASRDNQTANQFYNVSISSKSTTPVNLVLNQTVSVSGLVDTNGNQETFTIQGKALLKFEDSALQKFEHLRLKITKPGVTYSVDNITPLSSTSKGSGYTEHTFVADISNDADVKTGIFKDGDIVNVSLEYVFSILDPSDPTALPTEDFNTVNGYSYKFAFADSQKPRFISAAYGGTQLSGTSVNVLNQSSVTVNFTTANMSGVAGDYKVMYNGAPITPKNLSATGFEVPLSNLPAGTGILDVTYTKDTVTLHVQYSMNVQISPYIQLTYFDGTGQQKTFESGYQAISTDDLYALRGKVYNYDLNAGNIVVKLNGETIEDGKGLDVTSSTATNKQGTFTINKTKIVDLITQKGQGEHHLEIELTSSPSVSYSYTILYISSKAPTIEDIKLEINENGKTTELTKAASETSYKTSSKFLSGFRFKVGNGAEHMYIEKNGKRIVDYRYENGDWKLKETNQEYNNTLGEIPGSSLKGDFEDLNFEPQNRTTFQAQMKSKDYGDLIEAIQDNISKATEQENVLALFPLTLKKNGSTNYTIVAEDSKGAVVRYDVRIDQTTSSWEVISPVKAKESDQYIIVNSNSVPIKIYAENATKVLFGKTEAVVTNTTNPDFEYDDDKGREVPQTYYVFKATVQLKKGLNKIKYQVQVGSNTYNDEVQIFNANSSVNGAEYRDILGKKVSFSVFEKALELKFPAGTVLLTPENKLEGEEVKNPLGDIFVDVPLYFGIADRTTGQVTIPDDNMKSKLRLEENFNYASPMYYIDAGDQNVPGGRDPYEDDGDEIEEFKSRYEDNLVPSKTGSLSIKYDVAIVNAANNILTVFYHNGDKWQNIGGVVNTGKKVISVPFKGFGYYIVLKTRESFDDVVTHDFARDAMETLYSKGIMTNYSSNTFGANRDISRGEFATMLVKALALPINDGPYEDSRTPSSPTFNDVRPSRDRWDYEYKYIETAARAGIVRGKEPGYFRPDHPLTREEAAIMIARALNMKLGTLDASKIALGKMFEDAKDVGYYAAPSVLVVAKAKLMNGEVKDPNAKKPVYRFVPKANLTRAEMAVITIRVMVQLKKLPKQ